MPLEEFGFGLGPLLRGGGHPDGDAIADATVWAAMLMSSAGLLHYYLDSFIWKLSDERTLRGL